MKVCSERCHSDFEPIRLELVIESEAERVTLFETFNRCRRGLDTVSYREPATGWAAEDVQAITDYL